MVSSPKPAGAPPSLSPFVLRVSLEMWSAVGRALPGHPAYPAALWLFPRQRRTEPRFHEWGSFFFWYFLSGLRI
jgi:hypothetical protein